ncbi:neutral cholesterol ester hydrolase 1-like [Diadema antillarum]|uniref:neutral cholesterol ester hydrolase 1-like n=1 Tax=Diadema antillarum TaxID=105358 RepID=UPI003A8A73E2
MKTSITILVLCLALLLGHLLNTPVPSEMADPWQYRLVVAGYKLVRLIAAVKGFVHPADDNLFKTYNYLMGFALPAADQHAQGSTVQARYTDFDGTRVLLYETRSGREGLSPALVYFHGGGYAMGNTRAYGPLTRRLAEELDMVVVSVEYRLAPVHPFPAAIEDSLKATKWFLRNAAQFGVDPTRVAVGGDSAGGHISAVIAQQLDDDPSVPDIKLQVLIYPWLQIFDFHTPSCQNYERMFGDSFAVSRPHVAEFVSALVLGRLDNHFMDQLQRNEHTSVSFKKSELYKKILDYTIIAKKLGQTTSTESGDKQNTYKGNETLWKELKDKLLDPRLSPMVRVDFKGLPTAFIATCELDSLRDDGIFYARLLEEAGVRVMWKNYAGVFHGASAAGPITIPSGAEIIDNAISFIRSNI